MDKNQEFDDYLVKIPGKVTPFRNDPDLYCLNHKGELELCHSRSKISAILTLYQKQKRIKKCRNLKLLSTSHVEGNSYPISCKKNALYWHILKNKIEEPEVLIGCPPNCEFYKPMWKEKIKKDSVIWLSKFLKLKNIFRSKSVRDEKFFEKNTKNPSH